MTPARLKRAFVLPFFALQLLVLGSAGVRAVATGLAPVWLGPLISAGAFLAFFGWILARGRARTSANLPGVLGVSGAGLFLTLAAGLLGSTPAAIPALHALAAFGSQLLYVFWYSRLGRRPSPQLEVGETLPELLFEDENGKPVSTTELIGRPAVLLFHRGNWCPLCVAQVREMAERYRELEDRGATVALVSPQSHAHTRQLAARFDAPFRFWVDPGSRAARALGILHESGVPLGLRGYDADTVLPTAVVTDAEGRILLADQTDNYRVRPEPGTFLAALDLARA